MAGNLNIKNANGKTLTIQNPDTNNADIVIDGNDITTLSGNQTIAGIKTFSNDLITNKNVGVGTSSILSSQGRAIHIYNDINDGTTSSNSTLFLESVNKNSNIFLKGGSASLQFIDTSDNTNGVLVFNHTNKTLTMNSPAAIGYGTGAGGTVTQLTSKGTAVTLNKPCGQITMHNGALAAGGNVYFTVNNSILSLTDGIIITQNDNGNYFGVDYEIRVVYKANGHFGLIVKNVSPGTLSDAVNFRFDIIKGANS